MANKTKIGISAVLGLSVILLGAFALLRKTDDKVESTKISGSVQEINFSKVSIMGEFTDDSKYFSGGSSGQKIDFYFSEKTKIYMQSDNSPGIDSSTAIDLYFPVQDLKEATLLKMTADWSGSSAKGKRFMVNAESYSYKEGDIFIADKIVYFVEANN